MACAFHGPASLCGPDCGGFLHSDVPDAPPPAPPPPPDAFDDFGDMPEGSSYPEGEPSEPSERVGDESIEVRERCGAIAAQLATCMERIDALTVQLSKAVMHINARIESVAAAAHAVKVADANARGADARDVADANVAAIAERTGGNARTQ